MISVLMSVYNESIDDVRKSIDSVLRQTYKDFEVIIVLDNPEFREALELLERYSAEDGRVKVLVNEKNIGLAMSMNKAADAASGEYLLRMDADDICTLERFEVELEAIEKGGYDLVCSDYDFIDENGNALDISTPIYTGRQISALLPLRNVIHHPTVIMKASSFFKVGGYRNYLCAQDYDLWLRMKVNGCKFYMVNQKLLHYRVRTSSTTVKHRYKQVCTLNYISSLYRRHGKNKMQGYSYEDYLEYLKKHKADDPERQADYIKNFEAYKLCTQQIKSGKPIRGIWGIIKIRLFSRYFKIRFIRTVKVFMIKKFKK